MSIRIKSFDLTTETHLADEFLKDNRPISNGGIQLNNGRIAVIYEDGELNMNNFPKKFKELLGKEIETIEEAKHKILRNNRTIKELAPKGYKKTLTDAELKELFAKAGDDYKTTKTKLEAIVECENSNLLCAQNIKRSQEEIELYKQTIESYNK